MTIKVGDKVRFTDKCEYSRFHEAGIEGTVVNLRNKENYRTPIYVDVKHDELLNKLGYPYDDKIPWPCREDELEKVM